MLSNVDRFVTRLNYICEIINTSMQFYSLDQADVSIYLMRVHMNTAFMSCGIPCWHEHMLIIYVSMRVPKGFLYVS
jgi:hypothetical protein